MILSCSEITKSFDTVDVLRNVTFHLEAREKTALVGLNGAGKTTLFQILRGAYSPDSGVLSIQKGLQIGYLPQQPDLSSDELIEDELFKVFLPLQRMEEKMQLLEEQMKHDSSPALLEQYARLQENYERQDGFVYRSRVRGILKGLGFAESEYRLPITCLSGGQKSRVALSKLLLQKPDLLLLDEPTNHLDIEAIQWLEDYLASFSGAALIISHDRYFLDKVCTKTIELERGVTAQYSGNYSFYMKEKEMRLKVQMREYEAQQTEIKRQEEIIARLRSFSQEKFIKRAQSREKILEKMNIIEKPITYEESIHFTFTPQIESGNDVLTAHELSKHFDGKVLFDHLNLLIRKGQKVALLGANGTGKTTFFRIIMNQETPTSGNLIHGVKVFPGYYDQEQQNLNYAGSVLEEIYDTYPQMTLGQVRNVLAAFLFRGDDVFKQVGTLSGGEKARLSLCKIMLSNCNFLLLDEPTNHLDISSREVLENNLKNYKGTLFFISHDRYFINRVADRICVLTPNGIESYEGNYDDYLAHQALMGANADDAAKVQKTESPSMTQNKENFLQKKQNAADLRKARARLRAVENEIAAKEARQAEIDETLQDPEAYSDHKKILEIQDERERIDEVLLELYEEWESLSSSLEV